jgi:hypothetical protein
MGRQVCIGKHDKAVARERVIQAAGASYLALR